MSEIISLPDLASQINAAIAESKALYQNGINAIKQALMSDKEAGDLLIQVKESLPHGQFLKWIECHCNISERHARRLMSVSRNWDKIIAEWEEDKTDTRVRFEPLVSLRAAVAIATKAEAESKQNNSNQKKPETFKVNSPNHSSHNQVVTVVEELHKGDLLICKTRSGNQPFLRKELVSVDMPLEQIVAEIVEEEEEVIIDKSEDLREAIALTIEYFPETVLKALLSQALFIGREYLPETAQSSASKLLCGAEMTTLSVG